MDYANLIAVVGTLLLVLSAFFYIIPLYRNMRSEGNLSSTVTEMRGVGASLWKFGFILTVWGSGSIPVILAGNEKSLVTLFDSIAGCGFATVFGGVIALVGCAVAFAISGVIRFAKTLLRKTGPASQ